MVCESVTKNPAIQPGEGARAIDTFRVDYIADGDWNQAVKAVRKNQMESLEPNDYFEEYACMMAFLSGYAPKMPVAVANKIVSKLIKERRQL